MEASEVSEALEAVAAQGSVLVWAADWDLVLVDLPTSRSLQLPLLAVLPLLALVPLEAAPAVTPTTAPAAVAAVEVALRTVSKAAAAALT